MTRPLSEALRRRVIEAGESGMSRRVPAERFGNSVASAVRWVKRWRETGARGLRAQGGDQRSHRIEAYRDEILAAVEAEPDMTLVEIAEVLRRARGLRVAPSTVWRLLDRHAMTVKKNCARQRAGAARGRAAAARLVQRSA